jgi:pimeloyl-ACP methyl ester carboxylesterase
MHDNALTAPTRFADVGGRTLAYRMVGTGPPIVLCNRFRGVLDLWDPAFLDGLATRGFTVVTFDYAGLGQSTGERTYNPASLAKDAKDLIDELGLKHVVIGGWSIGGIAAQIFLALFGADVSHVVLLATTPPGHLSKQASSCSMTRPRNLGSPSLSSRRCSSNPMMRGPGCFRTLGRSNSGKDGRRPFGCSRRLGDRADWHLTTKPGLSVSGRASHIEDHARASPSSRRRPRHHLPGRELVRVEPSRDTGRDRS